MEKVTGIGGFFFRAKDPKALGVVPAAPGNLAHTIERRGVPFGSKRQAPPFSRLFLRRANIRGCPKGLDGELSSPGSRQMAATSYGRRIEIKIDPQSYPNGRFARVHDPEGNPIELWQPCKAQPLHASFAKQSRLF